jgi:hypothetical protein
LAISIDITNLPVAILNRPYQYVLQATGGTTPLKWSVLPSLPPGLTLDAASGTIQGIPTTPTIEAPFTFTVADSAGVTDQATLSLAVLDNSAPMSTLIVKVLAAYLLFVICICGIFIYSLWSSKPPSTAYQNQKVDALTVIPSEVDLGAPQRILILSPSITNPKVKINNVDRLPLAFDQNYIIVGLTATDVAAVGPLEVGVSKDGTAAPEYKTISVIPVRFYWKIFGYGPWQIETETQLLLLVLLVGAFASSVYSFKSLGDYRGANQLEQSWTLHYLIQPLAGCGAAFIFYLLIRAGFFPASNTAASGVNLFGMCAIAALAGMFSDMAFMKFREVFQTLFRPQDARGGKISGVKMNTTTLPDGKAGTLYSQTLLSTGGVPPLKWSVSPVLPSGLILNSTTGVISGTPTAATAKSNYSFTVTDSGEPPTSATSTIRLEIVP